MSEEEKTEQEETPQEPAAEEAAPDEAPDPADSAPEEPAAEEPAPEEPEAGDAEPEPDPADPGREAEESAGSDSEPAPQEPAEPVEVLSPKAQRKQDRTRHTGDVRPQRSPDERAAERSQQRAKRAAERRRTRARARSKHEAGQGTPAAERRPGAKKVRQGKVVSDKADKTITVQIEITRRHPVYEKVVRRTTTIHAHDEGNEANAGDVVRVIEARPLSRTKRWRLVEVLERAR
jgi:small subunit ribosomal protein S17